MYLCNYDDIYNIDLAIDFTTYKDVSDAFTALSTVCQKVCTKASIREFKVIRNACVARASKLLSGLIKVTNDIDCLFAVLAENNKYYNWMEVRFLTIIAIAYGNTQLQLLIQNYETVIYTKTLREVWIHIPRYSPVRDLYYSEVKATFGDKDPDNMTVEELIKSKPLLAKKIALFIAVIEEHSIVATWLIPTNKLYQAYLSFLTVPQQSRKNELIQFGTWIAYPPQHILQKYAKEINCG